MSNSIPKIRALPRSSALRRGLPSSKVNTMITHSKTTSTRAEDPGAQILRQILSEIAQALQGLQYGDVTVLVRDGGVVRIERTEKTRLFRGTQDA
jgi:hypothetical protein